MLFILADDLGYGDLSCYGRPDYHTPVLDAFAKQGMKFMSAYAAAPVCTPTRCAYMTGRYPQRLAVGLEEPLTRALSAGRRPAAGPSDGRVAAEGATATTRRSSANGISAGGRSSARTATASTSSSAS